MVILDSFCYFCRKTYLFGSHWNHLIEAIPMSTHKVCFGAKMNFIIGVLLLSEPVNAHLQNKFIVSRTIYAT